MEKLEARRDYLEQWLERHKAAQDLVPSVQASLEVTNWEIDALSSRPPEADAIALDGLGRRFAREYDDVQCILPMAPSYSSDAGPVVHAVTTSGAASTYVYVASVGGLGTEDAREYAETKTAAYRELQAAQSRPQEARALLEKLAGAGTLARFDAAAKARAAAKSGTGARTAAATDMRNLLYGLRGDLFERACRWPRENMTWPRMAERLSRGGTGGTEHQELVAQEALSDSLVAKLSDVLKEREGACASDVDHLWAQVLDHIYVVLELIETR
jgi:hypothetical protein